MNINLTDVELEMIATALEAVWWDQNPRSVRGHSQADRAKRLQRKLARAVDHIDTVVE